MNTPIISDPLLKTLANRLADLGLDREMPSSWIKALLRGDVVLVVVDTLPQKIEVWPVQNAH